MKKIYNITLLLACSLLIFSACKKEEASVAPLVFTTAAANITETGASSGGDIKSEGSAAVSERGICWAATPNPTTENTKKAVGLGLGEFTADMTDLKSGTTYFVRAYAITGDGTVYGDQRSFTTEGQLAMTLPFVERFRGAEFLPQFWQMIDQDKDGNNWYQYSSRFIGAISDSYNGDPLTPYNLLLSPKITILGTNPKLEWNVGATSVNYPQEHYKVVVSDQKITEANCTTVGAIVFEETLTTAAGRSLVARSVSLSSYTGKDVYVAWVHYNCEDLDGLVIADVRMGSNEMPATVRVASLAALTVANVGSNAADVSSSISNDGGVSVYSRGLCYGFNPNPTPADSKVEISMSASAPNFAAKLNLEAGKTYYVRAYAINAAGTAYSNEQTIATPAVIKTSLFFEDFTAADPFTATGSQWVLIDKDGDGKPWTYFADDVDQCARSRSYQSGALTPENYMVIPPVEIPADAKTAELNFSVAAAHSTDVAESYTVQLSTVPVTVDNCQASAIIKPLETLTIANKSWTFTGRTVDISAYKGQKIYIIFVHKDCTDQSSLLIDNIELASYK